MEKKKLLINLPKSFFTVEELKERFAKIEEKYDVRKTSHDTHEQIAEDLKWAEAIMMWSWPILGAEEFKAAEQLEILAQINTTKTTAVEATKKGITLSEVRHAWSPAVSEMALTLMLAGLRRTSDFHMKMRTGNDEKIWVEDFPADIDPRERQLTGRKVGIVGFGAIGQRLAELLKPFQVDLLINDPFLPKEVSDRFGAKNTTTDEICRECEIIVLCAANTPEAEKTISARHINAMKKDTVLVNVGRSMLIDMDALAERLKKNDMTAMLDVFDNEPLEKDSVFRSLENAYLTPHRAGGIYASVYRSVDWLMNDIDAFFAGKEIKYRISEKMAHCFPD